MMSKEDTNKLGISVESKGRPVNMKIAAGLLALVMTGSAGGYAAVKSSAPNPEAVNSAIEAANDIKAMRQEVTRMSANLDALVKSVEKDRTELERRIVELEKARLEVEKRLAKLEADKK